MSELETRLSPPVELPDAGPDSLDSIVRLLALAEARYEAAQDDETWLAHWLIWMALDELYWQHRARWGQ